MTYENEPELELKDILINDHVTKIFLYLRTQTKSLGVREIRRALNFSSVGSTHWHLQKLIDANAIEKVQGNRYEIHEKYAEIKQVPLKVIINHYFIGNKLVPNVFFLLFFILNILCSEIVLTIFGAWFVGCIIGILSFAVILSVIFSFYQKITSSTDIPHT